MNYTSNSFFRIVIVLLFAVTACRTSRTVSNSTPAPRPKNKLQDLFSNSNIFSANFTGFELYDPQSDSVLYAQNEKRYFTPASNTKLFTFYTSIKTLPKKLPGLKYVVRGDSLIFWGTGDPSFLRTDLDNGTVYKFLKNSAGDLYYSDTNFKDALLGPGWSCGDYQYAYSAERSPFPMYGNLVHFTLQKVTSVHLMNDSASMKINPPFFRSYFDRDSAAADQADHTLLSRGIANNNFRYTSQVDTSTFVVAKPYHYTPQLITKMLSDTLHKPVSYVRIPMPANTKTIYSVWADTVYKHMLQPSDNFIAEQLLLVAASELGKPLDTEWVIAR